MSIAQSLLPEYDHEMANTRKTLERIPENHLDYKPDPKSMSLGRLAGHITEMVGWGGMTLTTESMDIDPTKYEALAATSRAQVLEVFDKNVASTRAAIAGASDAAFMTTWSLSMQGNPMFSMPRIAVMRSMILSHVIHHRGQLTVYLRCTGVPVPALYGPSADEGNPASASA